MPGLSYRLRRANCAVALLVMATGPVLAHHSYGMFDMQKSVPLKGTVKDFQWTNPHCFIQLLVPGKRGPEEWSIEMGSPLHLARNGWKQGSVHAGDVIAVEVHPLRDGTRGGSLASATDAAGKPIGKVAPK
jgi:hypothetical protein